MSNLSGRGQLTGIIRNGSGGGGGSEVIINPSGAAIGTMEKISVDGDIYEVRNVPDATSASNGDVLTRSASGVGWHPPTKELPVFTSSDNNKILTINNETLSWETIPKELPTITSSDEGKVLGVSNGAPVWVISSGGGGGNFIDTSTIITSGQYTSTFSYVAVQDCYMYANLVAKQQTGSFAYIDGVVVDNLFNALNLGGAIQRSVIIPLKTGQTFSIDNSEAWSCDYAVYGISK